MSLLAGERAMHEAQHKQKRQDQSSQHRQHKEAASAARVLDFAVHLSVRVQLLHIARQFLAKRCQLDSACL